MTKPIFQLSSASGKLTVMEGALLYAAQQRVLDALARYGVSEEVKRLIKADITETLLYKTLRVSLAELFNDIGLTSKKDEHQHIVSLLAIALLQWLSLRSLTRDDHTKVAECLGLQMSHIK